MTEQEKKWFDALTNDREENASVHEKPSERGYWHSVVDKYSDQAHFVYELLQNADDAKATYARFSLSKDGLIFVHNGRTLFSVSNPEDEEQDKCIGHINSICSVGNSTKTESSIGKFGIGFKAVFQYTKTPHIYDPGFHFKIERFIVPKIIQEDYPDRKQDETLFWFPFDHEPQYDDDTLSGIGDSQKKAYFKTWNGRQKLADAAYAEIVTKLKALVFPSLFLSSIESVYFEVNSETGKETGKYSKQVIKSPDCKELKAQLVLLVSEKGEEKIERRFWLFSRSNAVGYSYRVGYALNDKEKLEKTQHPAFCFFPTKVTTNLSFIIHAPFLLTDNREGIKAGEKHNQDMLQSLAVLAADSMPILRDQGLIDDGIVDIIPYDESVFTKDGMNEISFLPFYKTIKEKLQSDTLLPALNGNHSSKEHSYWASDKELVALFTDEQLALLTGTPDARWVFPNLGKKEVFNTRKKLADYIDGGDERSRISRRSPNLIRSSLNPEDILEKITADFVSKQTLEWLHSFYKYLADRPSYQKIIRKFPIFIDQNEDAVPAFDEKNQLVLFLPDDDMPGYRIINEKLLSNETTCKFVADIGIKKPDLYDEIYTKIIPQYESGMVINHETCFTDFKKIFRYFKECRNDAVGNFVDLVKDMEFLLCNSAIDEQANRCAAKRMYFPNDELKVWFSTKSDTKFLLLDKYRKIVNENEQSKLDDFFKKLGIHEIPEVIEEEIDFEKAKQLDALHNHSARDRRYIDKHIDGCQQIVDEIDVNKSVLVWCFALKLHFCVCGEHRYSYSDDKCGYFDSSETKRLRSANWILNKAGELVSTKNVTVQALSDKYDTASPEALAFIKFLEIREEVQESANFSDEEKKRIEIGRRFEKYSDEQIARALEILRHENTQISDEPDGFLIHMQGSNNWNKNIGTVIKNNSFSLRNDEPDGKVNSITEEILICTKNHLQKKNNEFNDGSRIDSEDANDDTDIYTPRLVNYSRKIERAKNRCVSEIVRLEHEQELMDKVKSLQKYTYGWFLTLLELECMASAENNGNSKQISIRFGRVERDMKSARTIVLKQPNHFIPQAIEEFSGIRVDLDFTDGSKKQLHVESFTAKEFILAGKLTSDDELKDIDFDKLVEAKIDLQNPSFLIRSLLEQFRLLPFADDYDMKAELPENIDFIFGPPGTGKTTYLAEDVLIQRIRTTEEKRILVLTPTNKAADVLTTRIIEKMGSDVSYKNWLIRFGTSPDEKVEQAGVLKNRSFNINNLPRTVVVTTIARFAYDGFSTYNGKLFDHHWDFIVIDEASMIPLVNIIYLLYKAHPEKFIIAGDPFQIEPIAMVEQWKDENIYTLVGLNTDDSFVNPRTVPHEFNVKNLETQYRSLPSIGNIFSRFAYNGMLKHNRNKASQRMLRIDKLPVKQINLVKFPVSKYESIYHPKRLASGTPYQVYSALFSFEFLHYLSDQIAKNHANEAPFNIGVIAPYRAQADIIDKLVNSWDRKPQEVSVQVGTIHGFQGDECDIVITVFNPPQFISSNSQIFLNKRNILNVAISRARDYLFVIMPDKQTENIESLKYISKIENIIKQQTGTFYEISSNEAEKIILGKEKYLEENTFSTGHQMVNAYKYAERHYEVRSDDFSIDIQIQDTANSISRWKMKS